MRQQQQNPNLNERVKSLEWLTWLPALSVAVIMRRDIGARLLHRGYINGVVIFLLIASMFVPIHFDANSLRVYAGLVFICAFYQVIARWRERRKGIKQHSYYVGTSSFDRFLPAFFKRNRISAMVLDPLFACGCGLLVITISPFLGVWLLLAGTMLAYTEIAAYGRQREIVMDMVDGLVQSEYQGDLVEHYEQPLSKQQQQNTSIATGLGGDIQEKIKRRNSK